MTAEPMPIDAQRGLRRFHDARHRPLGRAGKGGKDQALDHEDQPERGQEILHACGATFSAPARRRRRRRLGAAACRTDH